jgi:hypothetical protein
LTRADRSRRADSQPLVFRPGQTLAIRLGNYTDGLNAAIGPTKPLAELTEMEINLAGFFFESGL